MDNEEKKLVLTEWIDKILDYFTEIGFEYEPMPKVVLEDEHNDEDDLFIRTGYYAPDSNELHLFIDGRHIKDILRTFCHEMVHRNQTIRDPNFGQETSDKPLAEDPVLKKIEGEAFLYGNYLFRGFTEQYTHQGKKQMNERRTKWKRYNESSYDIKVGDKVEEPKAEDGTGTVIDVNDDLVTYEYYDKYGDKYEKPVGRWVAKKINESYQWKGGMSAKRAQAFPVKRYLIAYTNFKTAPTPEDEVAIVLAEGEDGEYQVQILDGANEHWETLEMCSDFESGMAAVKDYVGKLTVYEHYEFKQDDEYLWELNGDE